MNKPSVFEEGCFGVSSSRIQPEWRCRQKMGAFFIIVSHSEKHVPAYECYWDDIYPFPPLDGLCRMPEIEDGGGGGGGKHRFSCYRYCRTLIRFSFVRPIPHHFPNPSSSPACCLLIRDRDT